MNQKNNVIINQSKLEERFIENYIEFDSVGHINKTLSLGENRK